LWCAVDPSRICTCRVLAGARGDGWSYGRRAQGVAEEGYVHAGGVRQVRREEAPGPQGAQG